MTDRQNKPSAGSLFSGVGGVDLGAERAGFRTGWTAEIDSQARAVLRRHFPAAGHMEDVRDVGSEKEGIKLLTGGFPCQDLSVAGKRRGLDGDRSGLWFEFRRVIAETAPEWVFIENVPGLLSSNDGEDFAVLLEGLAGWRPEVPESGWGNAGWIGACSDKLYGAVWRVLDTQGFGVPQRRRRIFIVARSRGRCPVEVLLERACLPGDSESSGKEREGSTGKIGRSSEGGGGEGRGLTLGFDWQQGGDTDEEIAATLSTTRTQDGLRAGSENKPIGFTKQGGFGISESGDGPMNTLQASAQVMPGVVASALPKKEDEAKANDDVAATLRSGGAGGVPSNRGEHGLLGPGGSAPDAAIVVDMGAGKGGAGTTRDGAPILSTWGAHAVLPEEREDVEYAADVSGPLHTSVAGGSGDGNDERVIIQAAAPRRLTPTECERLQGFPDEWTIWGIDDDGERIEMADTPRYRMMGNAVSVPVAEWICSRILAVSQDEDPDTTVAGLPSRYWTTVSEEWRRESS